MSSIKFLLRQKTPYNDILVIQNGTLVELWFVRAKEFFLQSRIDVSRPEALVLVYSRMMMAALLFRPEVKRVLSIGLGGAVLTNFLDRRYPGAAIDVVEIDKKVVQAAKKYFFFRETDRYRVHVGDGRIFACDRQDGEKYDLILLDAFKSGSMPYHLKTLQFYANLRGLLAPGGVLASNLYGKSNSLKPRDWKTFAATFRQTYFFEDPEEVATVLIATEQEARWSAEDLQAAAARFLARGPFPLDMNAVAGMYRPGKFADESAQAFADDFAEADLRGAAERHNDNSATAGSPYPIRSYS